MTEPATYPPDEHDLGLRPDPLFKRLTIEKALAAGLKLASAELPQTLTADLVLEIPPGVSLEGTLFSFLQGFEYVVMDFKSENDPLDMNKLQLNIARTASFCSRQPETQPERVLNLIVSSRYPQDMVKRIKPGLKRIKDAKWLWRGGPSYQPLAFVVCRDLPLEPVFYEWLSFAPVSSQAFRKAVPEFVRQGRTDLIDTLKSRRIKELAMLLNDYLSDYTAEEQARMLGGYVEFLQFELDLLAEKQPELYDKLVSKIKPSKSLQSAEQVAEKLTAEQLRAILQRKQDSETNDN